MFFVKEDEEITGEAGEIVEPVYVEPVPEPIKVSNTKRQESRGEHFLVPRPPLFNLLNWGNNLKFGDGPNLCRVKILLLLNIS